MTELIYKFAEAIQTWLWGFTPGPLEPVYDEIGATGREPLQARKSASGANGLEPATGPMQMKRCWKCGELARLYKVDGQAVCSKCAKGGEKSK